MKKLTSIIAVSALFLAFTSCEKKNQMTDVKTLNNVKQFLKEKSGDFEGKIIKIRISEGKRLSNQLGMVHVDEVLKDNKIFHYSYDMDTGKLWGKPQKEIKKASWKYAKGIIIDQIDTDKIAKYIEEAKKEVPKGYVFNSIENIVLEEDIDRSINGRFKKKSGDVLISFTILITKEGEGTYRSGNKRITNYYELEFFVDKEGNLVMEESK